MQHDLVPTSNEKEQPGANREIAPSTALESSFSAPEVIDGEESKAMESIAHLLLEHGQAVESGTHVIPSPYEGDKVLDVTHYYGVETRLPSGDARYTIRAWRSRLTDEYRARIIVERERLGLSPDSHDEFFAEQQATGILVVSSWTDEVDGQPRKIEETLNFTRTNAGTESFMRTKNDVFPSEAPESLVGPYVTEIKLTGEPLSLEAAKSEGDATREAIVGDTPNTTRFSRALGKIGIRRRQ